MCAYVERDANRHEAIASYLQAAGLGDIVDQVLGSGAPAADGIVRSRPAFGGNPKARLFGMITQEAGQLRVYDPIWWFDVDYDEDQGFVFGKRTSFNARRLHLPLWKDWVATGRGLVVGTAIGEAKQEGSKKRQYRMVGETPFFLGGLIKPVGDGHYAGTVITRDAHPKFEAYHDKAFPNFVPPDLALEWLEDGLSQPVQDLLDHPTLTTSVNVTPVKSYQSAQSLGETVRLPAD